MASTDMFDGRRVWLGVSILSGASIWQLLRTGQIALSSPPPAPRGAASVFASGSLADDELILGPPLVAPGLGPCVSEKRHSMATRVGIIDQL